MTKEFLEVKRCSGIRNSNMKEPEHLSVEHIPEKL